MGIKVNPLQRNTEALLKLLGGTEDQRWQFWEQLKGITSRQFQRIIDAQLESAATHVQAVQKTLTTLQAGAKEISKT